MATYANMATSPQVTRASCTAGISRCQPYPPLTAITVQMGTVRTHQSYEKRHRLLTTRVRWAMTTGDECVVNVAAYIVWFLGIDPFDNPKPINRRIRTQSAPATIQLMRQKSASVYRSYPAGRRIMSAFPERQGGSLLEPRPLATGPVT